MKVSTILPHTSYTYSIIFFLLIMHYCFYRLLVERDHSVNVYVIFAIVYVIRMSIENSRARARLHLEPVCVHPLVFGAGRLHPLLPTTSQPTIYDYNPLANFALILSPAVDNSYFWSFVVHTSNSSLYMYIVLYTYIYIYNQRNFWCYRKAQKLLIKSSTIHVVELINSPVICFVISSRNVKLFLKCFLFCFFS